MDKEQYKSYSTEDFILDDDFRRIAFDSGSEERLNELMDNFPEKKSQILQAVQILRTMQPSGFTQSTEKKKELWQQIINQQKRQKRLIFLKYVASLIFLVGIGSLAIFITQRKPTEIAVVQEFPSDNAVLVLGNGKTVSISNKKSTIQYSADGLGVVVNDSTDVFQTVSDNEINQLIVPYGKRSFITLSDGTKVWMNSGSKLIFPPVFKGNTREVVLVGEAFFDVCHNATKPFFVKTDAFKMKVYGTRFNVQAYTHDNEYNVVLVEGKVSLNSTRDLQTKEIFLAPSQKASVVKGSDLIEVNTVENTEMYTAWIDGYLTFTDEEVKTVLKRISRYYNVEIDADFAGKKVERIYGKLDLKDDLARVLEGIAFISETSYEKEGNKYVFKTN